MSHLDFRTRATMVYPPSTSSMLQQYVSSIILLIIGYYAVSYLDRWPSIVKRFVYEITVKSIPSRLVFGLQYIMTRIGYLKQQDAIYRKEDFGDWRRKEDALRRMFGQTAIPSMLKRARTLSGYDRLMPSSIDNGPPGLGNWDNSCYQNSILQGLASLPAFQQYIHRSLQLCQRCDTHSETTEALATFLEQLANSSCQKTTLWTPAVLKSMDSWQQQDAQEYFSRIADAVEKEALQYTKILFKQFSPGLDVLKSNVLRLKIPTRSDDGTPQSVKAFLQAILNSPMDGMQAQALECQTCGYSEGISLTQFNCLTLSLGLKGPCNLEQLLDEYTEPELIEGVECDECTKQANGTVVEPRSENIEKKTPSKQKKVLRTKAKQLTLGRLPKDLVFHINRSIFDDFGNQRKNPSLIQFGSSLKILNKWCAPMGAEDATDISDSHGEYQLNCIITHSGRHDNGHYVAYARRDKDWFCFNDEIVTKITEEEVLRRGNVFMLFYEAIDHAKSTSAEAFNPVAEELSEVECNAGTENKPPSMQEPGAHLSSTVHSSASVSLNCTDVDAYNRPEMQTSIASVVGAV